MLYLIVLTTTLSYTLAYPGYHYGSHKLQIVPDIESYGKIQYPHFDIIEFGEYRKNHIPPKMILETKKILIKEPKPYHVKVPYPVPYPVNEKVPVHLVNQEIVKVPKPIPYPVIQTVPLPIEVPRPYPVPINEFKELSPESGGESYQSDSSDLNQIDDVQFDASSLKQDNNNNKVSFQPIGLEQYNNLNDIINHQEDKVEFQQNYSEERPVYEDQKEDGAS